ncbi:hypothetical protein CLBKND_01681 [Methylorubrum aminovorans]
MSRPAQTVAELADRIAASRAATPARPERQFRHAVRGETARHGCRGNGGPALDEPEPRTLRLGTAEVLRLGQLLWGDRHTADLARLTGEDPGQVRRWRRGEGRGPDARAARWVREEAHARSAELTAAVEALDAVRPPPAPAAPEPEPAPAATAAPADPQADLEEWLAGAGLLDG